MSGQDLTVFKLRITLLFVQSKGVKARLRRAFGVKQQSSRADYRGLPTHACPCGEKVFRILATFDDFQISLYVLDAECNACGALLTAPCELDR